MMVSDFEYWKRATPPRPSTGGDADNISIATLAVDKFQSTPPHGERLSSSPDCTVTTSFQSTPPHGGRLTKHKPPKADTMFQSTPQHGGRHDDLLAAIEAPPVLIHAPARGGRLEDWSPCGLAGPFQSTPTHGGRLPGMESVSGM